MHAAPCLDRRALIAMGAAVIGQGFPSPVTARPIPAAMTCAAFLDTIGVNTHLEYANSQYNDVIAVGAALKYCGVRHARDGAVYDRAPNAAHYQTLAAAGVRFCMMWGPRRSLSDEMRQLDAFEAEHPGAVAALEGPNEIKPGFAYAGQTGTPAAQKFMSDMRTEAARYERLRRKPLVAFTGYSGYSCDCDFANVHPYPKGGQQPGAIIRRARDRWVGPDGFMGGKGMFFTEFGYHTLVGKPTAPGAWQGVDEERQAILLLNGWFDAAAMGVTRTYAYELLDEGPQRSAGAIMQNRFGLFHPDGAPKASATALKRLAGLLAGQGQGHGRRSQPAPAVSGFDSAETVSCLPLRHADGSTLLCVWNESPVWDPQTAAPSPATSTHAVVALSRPSAGTAWDPLSDRGPTELGRAARFDVSVGAHPLVLQFS
jgi:hypothetical protein